MYEQKFMCEIISTARGRSIHFFGFMLVKSHNVMFSAFQFDLSYYKLEGHFFRHSRRIAPKFCTHVRIETRLGIS